ncbi:terminase large subunit [Gordonia sp. N1V]|uniref:terminase large subunit domain-containing protein n=1 Tax=Gordonia sp. N1V TaxID=3034163 RepID=UPI0023E2A3A7|nr:terminase large subunit [Gordonia sp. N1V]MDF3283368.1 terminase large subunit [Gordonia sp. N1V]
MRPGAKGVILADPLSLKGYPKDRARRRERFIGQYLKVPKGVGALEDVKLRKFQRDIIREVYRDGIRTGLVSIPRANGKTSLAAMLAVAELFVGPASAEVLVVASDQRQSSITLRLAKRMIELNSELAERAHVYRDRIEVPENDASLVPLPAEPGALHGHDPSLLIVDELHVVTEEVWEAVTSVTGKRPESLTLAISTPAASVDSVMWKLVAHGRAGNDPAFAFKEYAAPEGCATDDAEAWRAVNPALACERPFLALDGMEAARQTLREPVFRQLRLGQWVGQVDRWLPWGAWEELASPEIKVMPRQRVVLAFDGSASGDSTALVGATLGPKPHLFLAGIWQNPGDPRWRVPRADVDAKVREMFDRYDVVELAADPWGWRSEIETWAARHGERRVLQWNTANAQRMAPATDRFYAAVTTGQLTHDGAEDLAAHLGNCVAKSTPQGDLVSKDKRGSPRKIDAAVAAIVALDRAAHHTTKKNRRRVRSFAS